MFFRLQAPAVNATVRLVFLYSSSFHFVQTSVRQPGTLGRSHASAWAILESILDISMIHFRAMGVGGFIAEPSNFWVAVSPSVSDGAATPMTWDVGTKNCHFCQNVSHSHCLSPALLSEDYPLESCCWVELGAGDLSQEFQMFS